MTVEPAQLDSLSKARTCVPALLQPNGDLVRIYLVINSLHDYGVVYNPFFCTPPTQSRCEEGTRRHVSNVTKRIKQDEGR